MPADPYTILGVSKNASADEVKKAYRKLAHQYHPDKKGGDEAKFKEINEAYQTLSDPDKKARNDSFGGGQYQNFDFSGMGFESIFDMFGGARPFESAQGRPAKGEDLHLQVQAAKKDLGQQKIYEFEVMSTCGTCDSSGVAPGAERITCSQCKGSGQVRQAIRTPFGTFAQAGVCSQCRGEGDIPEKLCPTCGGSGRIKTKRTLELHLPNAITDRHLIVFPLQGNAGVQGSPAGDLLITLRVK
jgi:molecular chaperone DnaJ